MKKQRKLSDLETAIVVVDRFVVKFVRWSVVLSRSLRATTVDAGASFDWFPCKTSDLSDCLSQPKIYRLNTWIADAPIALVSRMARSGHRRMMTVVIAKAQSDAGGCVDPFDERADGKSGMALGLPAVTETWIKLGVPKISCIRFRRCCWGR